MRILQAIPLPLRNSIDILHVKSPGNGKPQSALTAEKIAYTLGDVKLTNPTRLDGTPYAAEDLLADVRAAVARFEDRARHRAGQPQRGRAARL